MMRTNLRRLCVCMAMLLTAVCAPSSVVRAQNPCAPGVPGEAQPLASETFELAGDAEVGLEIDALSPDASWARKGAEAAALTVLVDGAYNQDVMLWAGEEAFVYRVALGRLRRGRHKVSVLLNRARTAAGARKVGLKEVRPLRVLVFPMSPAADEEQLARAYSPVLYARPNTFDHFTDIPLLMYYEVLREGG